MGTGLQGGGGGGGGISSVALADITDITAAGIAVAGAANAAAQRTALGLAAVAASGSASDLGSGTLPLARIVSLTDSQVAAANKDGATGTASMRTLGTGAQQAAAGNDSRLSDSRAPNGSAGGDLTGTFPSPTIAALAVTDAKVAAANKDGASGTACMRTLGSAAGKAAPGNRQIGEHGFINSPLVKSETIYYKCPRALTIVSFSGICLSGTVTCDIKINGTNVTGLAAQTYDSSGETNNATAAKTLAANDLLAINISAVSAAVDFAWTLLLAEAD